MNSFNLEFNYTVHPDVVKKFLESFKVTTEEYPVRINWSIFDSYTNKVKESISPELYAKVEDEMVQTYMSKLIDPVYYKESGIIQHTKLMKKYIIENDRYYFFEELVSLALNLKVAIQIFPDGTIKII